MASINFAKRDSEAVTQNDPKPIVDFQVVSRHNGTHSSIALFNKFQIICSSLQQVKIFRKLSTFGNNKYVPKRVIASVEKKKLLNNLSHPERRAAVLSTVFLKLKATMVRATPGQTNQSLLLPAASSSLLNRRKGGSEKEARTRRKMGDCPRSRSPSPSPPAQPEENHSGACLALSLAICDHIQETRLMLRSE